MGATLESRCWGDGPEERVRTGVDWEEEEDRAWADWCLGVLWGGALLGCFCRVSGEGRRRKAEFRCGQEHKSPGYLSFLPTTTGPQHNLRS